MTDQSQSPPPGITDEGASLPVSVQYGSFSMVSRSTEISDPPKLMSSRTLEWTSTRIPATSIGQSLQEKVTGFERLEAGIAVQKVTSRGALRPRVLTISTDKFALFCTHHPLSSKGVISTVANRLPVPFVTRKGMRGFTSDSSLRDKYVRYIDVADIDAVHVGVVDTLKLENARTANRLKNLDSEIDLKANQIVTIVHHGTETLDVLVPNDHDRRVLVNCLGAVVNTYHQTKANVSGESLLLRYIWYDIDVNRDGLINENEFVKILARINFHLPNPRTIYRAFLSNSVHKKKSLTYPQVMTLLQQQKQSAANTLWDEIFGSNKDSVSATEFMTKFCHNTQGELLTMDDVRGLIQHLNKIEINHSEGMAQKLYDDRITRARFEVLLFHELNDAYDPAAIQGDATPLDKPMSRYWINTSHNTYLTGDQLTSTSSVEQYMKALRRGCKCLEIDVWDGDHTAQGEPIPVVFHGYTVTSKILFADVIRIVKKYIDTNPETYPVILSLENHCSKPYQDVMAKILIEILGKDVLYVPTGDTKEDLPSPESLRGKVVIKGKRPRESDDTELEQGEDYDPYAETAATSGATVPKVDPVLSRLTLFHGTKYKEFERSINEPRSHMHSIGETKVAKILDKSSANTAMWRLYNVHHMTRTYPAGARVDSSNYSPVLPWAVGCQLVALNVQATDSPLMLNDGLFRQNAGAGYLLKPPSVLCKQTPKEGASPTSQRSQGEERDILDEVMDSFEEIACGDDATSKLMIRSNSTVQESLEAKEQTRMVQNQPIHLRIRVLSGSCLPKPLGAKVGETIDPYVTVTVHDVRQGNDAKTSAMTRSVSTKTVNDNGFCPVWNDEATQFTVYSPQVAMVQFSLKEKDIGLDDKVGEACIPISCLRKGYRSIQLYDLGNTRTGPFGFASLLVEIQMFTVIP